MTCWAWIAISLGRIYLIVLHVLVLFSRLFRRYWRENIYIPRCCNSGWIIEFFKLIFGFLNFISPSTLISWVIKEKRSKRCAHFFVDTWVFLSLAVLLYIFLNNIYHCNNCLTIPAGWVVWLIGFRMADLFQSWFNHFVLGGVPQKWTPVDPIRSLVIVFMGYSEIVIAYSILAYNYNVTGHLKPATCGRLKSGQW